MQRERLAALGQMASGIAHDINNSMVGIVSLTDLLLDDSPQLDERAQSHLKTMRTAGRDVISIVSRMREFYRKRTEDDELLPVELNRLVAETVEITRARWRDIPQQHGIVIQIETSFQDPSPTPLALEGELREALTNLIFNAVDALPSGGTITLRTRSAGQQIFLEAADSGIGMDPEIRQHCFEPFYTTKGDHGTGLGLSIVYGIMKRHDGTVEIDSAPGCGTTVRLVFPLRAATVRSLPVVPYLIPPRPFRILLVDDDEMVRDKVLKEILLRDGHSVVTADGGQAGLDLFRLALAEQKFDLVITDLGMPYLDGHQVARYIKAESPDTPVILLTGWGMSVRAEQEIPKEVDLVLSKPPRLEELRHAIAMVTSE